MRLPFLCLLVVSLRNGFCLRNLCEGAIDDEECRSLDFEAVSRANDKADGTVSIEAIPDQTLLNISIDKAGWNYAVVRLTDLRNTSRQVCAWFRTSNLNCFEFSPADWSNSFSLDYKVATYPQVVSRKIVFNAPAIDNINLSSVFWYVDYTDTACLILHVRMMPEFYQRASRRIRVWRERSGAETLLESAEVPPGEEGYVYKYHTYNEEGYYYFEVLVTGDYCKELYSCLQGSTPKIYVARRSAPLVIGIVGASFIIPFVLFIFHTLTRKYKMKGNFLQSDQKVLVLYQSSTKRHNDLVTSLARLLRDVAGVQVITDVIPKAKTKDLEKLCSDTLLVVGHVVYVAPPLQETVQEIDFDPKEVADKQVASVVFDSCTENLPTALEVYEKYRLLDDLDRFLKTLGDVEPHEGTLSFGELKKRLEEAKLETCANNEAVPMIVVTDPEPQEHDKLLSHKVVL